MSKKNNGQNNKTKNKLWKTIGGNFLLWLLIITMAVTGLQYFSSDNNPAKITYSQFQDYLFGQSHLSE